MQEVMKKVRHKSKIVAEVMVPVYATVEEILGAEPKERIVAVFNNGNHVRIMGNERAKHSGVRTGKKARTQLAFSTLTIEEMTGCLGDAQKLEDLLESDVIQARVDAIIAENAVDEDAEVDAPVEEEEVE
jgi:hypothetical protein